jgi:CheY-like chemotaxis protein
VPQQKTCEIPRRIGLARILIADDDPQYLAAFRTAVEALGHELIEVRGGKDVLRALEQHDIDLVFLDVLMPGGGAISLVHAIRDHNRAIPIVIITGNTAVFESPIISEGLRQANARVPKTIGLAELSLLIEQQLNARA